MRTLNKVSREDKNTTGRVYTFETRLLRRRYYLFERELNFAVILM